MATQTIVDVKSKIRDIKDFPKEGIIFRDITTALKDAETLRVIVDIFVSNLRMKKSIISLVLKVVALF